MRKDETDEGTYQCGVRGGIDSIERIEKGQADYHDRNLQRNAKKCGGGVTPRNSAAHETEPGGQREKAGKRGRSGSQRDADAKSVNMAFRRRQIPVQRELAWREDDRAAAVRAAVEGRTDDHQERCEEQDINPSDPC